MILLTDVRSMPVPGMIVRPEQRMLPIAARRQIRHQVENLLARQLVEQALRHDRDRRLRLRIDVRNEDDDRLRLRQRVLDQLELLGRLLKNDAGVRLAVLRLDHPRLILFVDLERRVDEVLQDIREKSPQFQLESETPYVLHLIFGPEDWGLSAEDLEMTNFCACLPTYGDNWSLNLAQATLLAMFSLRRAWGGERTKLEGQQTRRAPQGIEGINPDQTLKTWLTEMGFDLSKKRINVYTVLRRMLLQNTPTKKELVILETVLQQSIRKLEEYNKLRKKP